MTADGFYVYACTAHGGLYKSTYLGNNWISVNNGLPDDKITSMEYYNGSLLAGTKNSGIYKSDDEGESWYQPSLDISDNTEIRCLYGFENFVFTGTGTGRIYVSLDNGSSWVVLFQNETENPVLSLCVFDDYLYASVNGSGVWKYPVDLITNVNNITDNTSFVFYPNPAKGTITIQLNKENKPGDITIYNIEGKKIISHHIEKQSSIIDISSLISGVYFICYTFECQNKFSKLMVQ